MTSDRITKSSKPLVAKDAILKRMLGQQWRVIEEIRQGLPYGAIDSISDFYGLDAQDVRRVIDIRPRTAARRSQDPKPLSSAQSERLVRITTVMDLATAVLENQDLARTWLRTPNSSLNDQAPFELLDTGIGFEQVMVVLRRIEHGVYS